MHLGQQTLSVEHFQVAADRHVRDAKQGGQLRNPGAAGSADLFQDPRLAHGSEHGALLRVLDAVSGAPSNVPNRTN